MKWRCICGLFSVLIQLLVVVDGRSPFHHEFGRLFSIFRKEKSNSVPTALSKEPTPAIQQELVVPTRDHAHTSKLQEKALSLVRSVQQSPALQEFLLGVADKCISCGILLLAFKYTSQLIRASWEDIQAPLRSLKEQTVTLSSNSSAYSYLKPNVTLSTYEEEILFSLIVPESITDTMEDIGGLGVVKEAICDLLQPVQVKVQNGEVKKPVSSLLAPARSILLYGPPGCGKTMLARATCRRLRMPMLSVAPSLLLRMYVGETPRLTKALFTLAAKLQPCLIFIDEADSLFCARSGSDHAVDRKIVTEFMQLWDELLREHADVVIVGATNRPQDLDPAILRRFERSFLIPAPDLPARKDVLAKLLRGVELDADFDADRCAQGTEGYTASDLAAVCRAAVLLPIKEQARKGGGDSTDVRPLRTEDITEALKTVYPTAWASDSYARHSQTPSFHSPRVGRDRGMHPSTGDGAESGSYAPVFPQQYGGAAYYPQEQEYPDGAMGEYPQQQDYPEEEDDAGEWEDDDPDDEDNESQ